MTLDDERPLQRRVRSVLVGNCGELTGGVRLLPNAAIDDGWLDVVVVAPRGVLGWGGVLATVVGRRRSHPAVQYFRCRSIEVRADKELHVQLDGDPAGTAHVLRAHVDPLALTVRCAP
jgi:diacylglycerol kinase family enzyme